jgi:putative holliday junction resolvase
MMAPKAPRTGRAGPETAPIALPRTLAFDYGERRIGVAASDPTRTIASPLTTVHRRAGKRPPYPELMSLIQEHEADELVVGLPLDLGGDETAWTAEVRAFADGLASRSGLTVHWMDERMTSVRAERSVRGMGLRRGEREQKGRVDATAAALILEGWLALRQNRARQEEGL